MEYAAMSISFEFVSVHGREVKKIALAEKGSAVNFFRQRRSLVRAKPDHPRRRGQVAVLFDKLDRHLSKME